MNRIREVVSFLVAISLAYTFTIENTYGFLTKPIQKDFQFQPSAVKSQRPTTTSTLSAKTSSPVNLNVSDVHAYSQSEPRGSHKGSNATSRKFCVPTDKEIDNYKGIVKQIISASLEGRSKNQAYNRLALFTDTFGNRISGSANLENAIDYMLKTLTKDGLDNVHGEEVMVPHWVRGKESLVMLKPRNHNMSLLGLGSSIGTQSGGITAEVIVVKSFDELHQRKAEVKGKIVVFDEDWVSYGETVRYRSHGAVEVAKAGGLASLIRSVTPFSINSPHTGWQDYDDAVKKIPTACITVEDAAMLKRMADRGTKIVLHLEMSAKNLPMSKSRNTVAEIVGYKYPEQVVLVSGHLDSWDVGAGAMDDGAGAFVSWQVLSLIRQLKLKPKRTIRLVMWTGEEEGGYGGQAYFNAHKKNIKDFNLVMESDSGTFTPLGLGFKGNSDATSTMKKIISLLKPLNASALYSYDGETDIAQWAQHGVPASSLHVKGFKDRYFYFHHTDGDTMSVLDPHELNLCSAVWSIVAFVAADLECMLPR